MDESNFTRFLHWMYNCTKCGAVGSVPIAKSISMINAVAAVKAAHADFHPDCHKFSEGRWVKILSVSEESHRAVKC